MKKDIGIKVVGFLVALLVFGIVPGHTTHTGTDVVGPVSTPIDGTFAAGGGFFDDVIVASDHWAWYNLGANIGDILEISVDATGGLTLDPGVTLFSDPIGTGLFDDLIFLAENDDGGPGLNSFLSYTVIDPGIYYLAVSGCCPSTIGDFRITVEGNTGEVSSTTPVPEPSTLLLLGGGLLGMVGYARRKKA